MVASRAGASRAASVFSNATARDRIKRRDKPYKTEHQKIVAKKRKLAIRTSYMTQAPNGYTFLPVGTPDLAELCKELSRQRDLPVNVVNATPNSAKAADPEKLSHHVHRIGYHFSSSVLEDACEQLGYFPYKNQYVKPIDLQKQQQDSYLAQVLKKHGMKQSGLQESVEQVRAAIKELFPRIPDEDLDQIVKHAWEKGTGRVGSVEHLPLGRRVQLAVIARIRHKYTDYDQLLRAFGWANAREEVEPHTLQKLIEWRGENEEENGELEEIVRETIVIDDEDGDAANNAIGTQDGDSSDAGNVSDTSVEISHRPAAAHDLRVEEANERHHRYAQRWQPVRRTEAERTDIARAKLSAARGNLLRPQPRTTFNPEPNGSHYQGEPPRTGYFPQGQYDGRFDRSGGNSASSTPLRPIIIPSDSAERAREAPQWHQASPLSRVQYVQRLEPVRSNLQYLQPSSSGFSSQDQATSPYVRTPFANAPGAHHPEERAMPSIERGGSSPQARPVLDHTGYNSSGGSAQLSHPTTPDNARPVFRLPDSASHAYRAPVPTAFAGDGRSPRPIQYSHAPGWHGETIDLTTPDHREIRRLPPQPEIVRVVSTRDGWYRPVNEEPPSGFQPRTDGRPRQDESYRNQPAVGYDPAHPQLLNHEHGRRRTSEVPRYPEPQSHAPAYQGLLPNQQERMPTRNDGEPFRPQQLHLHEEPSRRPTVIYQLPSGDPMAQRRAPPAPVHGEPAPVQLMQRPVQYAAYEDQGQPQRSSAYDYPHHDSFTRGATHAPGNPSGNGFPAAQPLYPR